MKNLIWASAMVLVLCLGGLFSTAGAAMAGNCGPAGVCWGAVAVGEQGLAARASNQGTAPDAWEWADRACGGKCDRIEVFHSGCGAIVQGGRDVLTSGFGDTRKTAVAEALAQCEGLSGFCRVRVWACSE